MKLKQIMRSGIIGLATLTGANTESADQYVMADKDKITLDSRISGTLGRQVGFFGKTKITTPYSGPASTFALVDITRPIGKGVGAVYETQFSSDGVTPRLGLDYFRKIGSVSIYTETTAAKKDIESFTNVELAKGKLRLGIESITNIDYDGRHNFSVETGRVGYNYKGTDVGVAVDCSKLKHCTPRVYVHKTF